MQIEKATVNDIPELCDLLAVLFSQEAEFEVDGHTQQTGLQAIISNPDLGIILLARHNNKVVGMVSLLFSISTALGGRVAMLEDMVVLPEQRGLGMGSALLTVAIKTARENDCLRITLLTDSDNETAQGFYEKQGFVRSQMLAFRRLLT
jgi:ribosomal protein S18 acetylase RimI-like enzyme